MDWHIDTDMAMGSGAGDPDDGFAVAYAVASGLAVGSISSVFGNTSSAAALHCIRHLLQGMRVDSKITVSVGAASWGDDKGRRALGRTRDGNPVHILALGPLTNVAHWLLDGDSRRIASITLLGSNPSSRGRWPPVFPFEFNLSKDRWATKTVFRSHVPLRIVPLDVACRLQLTDEIVDSLSDERMPLALQREGSRWLKRSQRLGKRAVPVWDLLAAFWARHPELCRTEARRVRTTVFGRVVYDEPGGREVMVLRDFSPDQVWDYFRAAFKSQGTPAAPHANL